MWSQLKHVLCVIVVLSDCMKADTDFRHDWPEADCVTILTNIKKAMIKKKTSKLLIRLSSPSNAVRRRLFPYRRIYAARCYSTRKPRGGRSHTRAAASARKLRYWRSKEIYDGHQHARVLQRC